MTSIIPMIVSGGATAGRRWALFVLDCWRGIDRRQIGATFLLGIALFLFQAGNGAGFGPGLFMLFIAVAQQIKAFSLLLAFVVADRVSAVGRAGGTSASRSRPYVVAVLVGGLGAMLGAAFGATMMTWFVHPIPIRWGLLVYVYLDFVLVGGAAVWVIRDRQRARRARDLMACAERERLPAGRGSIESNLQAMQARVEPRFLFNTLAHVRGFYETDVTRGERMLDELIAYLRAAMPKMRDTSSTVGQELELAQAYLSLLQLRADDSFTIEVRDAGAINHLRMPPMMLLPLVDHAIAEPQSARGNVRDVRVSAAMQDAEVFVIVQVSTDALLSEGEQLANVRERLRTLFGASGRLEARGSGNGGSEAVLRFPADRAHQMHDAAGDVGTGLELAA